MRFGILGAGAVGGYFGARLAEAGEDVAFIARGAHLEAIRNSGLRIESENGDACEHVNDMENENVNGRLNEKENINENEHVNVNHHV